jgi:hypothetical protein
MNIKNDSPRPLVLDNHLLFFGYREVHPKGNLQTWTMLPGHQSRNR